MSNVIQYKWNILNDDEHNNYYNIKCAQNNVKQIGNPLAEKMFTTIIKSYMENRPVMSDVADVINNEWSMIKKVDKLSDSLVTLLNSISYPDLKHLFFMEDESKIDLWLIIKEKNFANTKKYIRTIREVAKENNLEVEYLIFDLEDKDKVIEQMDMEKRNFEEYI